MRISEVVRKTKIPKRTIYFYIHEGLIQPRENPENGYHNFTEEDVKNLTIISRLRKLDFSIADIRNILRFPGTASYYFYQQMDILTKRISTLQQNVEAIARYFDRETGLMDRNTLAASLELISEHEFSDEQPDAFSEYDARIIPLFIWTPYLPRSRNEYQEFLWAKVSKRVMTDYRPFLRSMKHIISALEPEQLQYSSERTYAQAAEIADLDQKNLQPYAQTMLTQISAFLDDEDLVAKWNLVYTPLIYPLLTIGYSEISKIMFEINDGYKQFYEKVSLLCNDIWKSLHETDAGRLILAEITSRLVPIDWEQNGKGELERMSVFSFSPYAILNKENIEKIILPISAPLPAPCSPAGNSGSDKRQS